MSSSLKVGQYQQNPPCDVEEQSFCKEQITAE